MIEKGRFYTVDTDYGSWQKAKDQLDIHLPKGEMKINGSEF